MTDREKLQKAEALLSSLREDARLGLRGEWRDKDKGWNEQINAITFYFQSTRLPYKKPKLEQIKMNI